MAAVQGRREVRNRGGLAARGVSPNASSAGFRRKTVAWAGDGAGSPLRLRPARPGQGTANGRGGARSRSRARELTSGSPHRHLPDVLVKSGRSARAPGR